MWMRHRFNAPRGHGQDSHEGNLRKSRNGVTNAECQVTSGK
jgi:hypothetical protein